MNNSAKTINQLLKHGFRSFFGSSKNRYNLGSCNLVEIGNVSPELIVPDHIPKPDYYFKFKPPTSVEGRSEIKNATQIEGMRTSCRLAAKILNSCEDVIKTGMTTDYLDKFVHEQIINANAYPSPLRYAGFPKSVCTSVNNVACHGIPDDRPLMDGDIVNVDITVFYDGYHGDCSKTFLVGNVDERGKFLIDVAKKCLNEAISICAPNQPIKNIGKCIETIASHNNLNVIPAFIGHGIGSYFHGPPEILHYENDVFGIMKPGMTFTIEPILSLGSEEIEILDDGWTAISVDNSRSAQFEHTILITDNGVEILTLDE